jgi:hypothetical protein
LKINAIEKVLTVYLILLCFIRILNRPFCFLIPDQIPLVFGVT